MCKIPNDMRDIGFYTLSNDRIHQVSPTSPLWRAELLITDLCNFKCPYCRGVKDELAGTLPTAEAIKTLQLWISQGLKNVRLSGGEPMVHKGIFEMASYCRDNGVERIAISTNGSFPREMYDRAIDAGINDFSISLDACCAQDGDKMAGGISGAWEKVVANIRHIASRTYVTVGIVLTNETVGNLCSIVEFAHDLGVADIRIISAAQFNETLLDAIKIPQHILDAHPILKYRVNNMKSGRNVRGLQSCDNNRCPLVIDDVASVAGKHFPCIIYLRERGAAIGDIGPNMRADRVKWAREHDTHADPICKKNCLDVCCDYNNKFVELRGA